MSRRDVETSIWEREALFGDFELIVIGAGLTGLYSSIQYAQKRSTQGRILVLDRHPFIRRGSTRNAGFAVFGSLSELLDDIDQMGQSEALDLMEWRARSVLELKDRFSSNEIDYRPTGGMELFFEHQETLYDRSIEIMDIVNDKLSSLFGAEVFRLMKSTEHLPFRNLKSVISNPFEGLLHPGKLIRTLEQEARSAGIELKTGLDIQEIERSGEEYKLSTNEGLELRTERVLVATNGLAANLLPEMDVRPARNVILISEPIPVQLPDKACHNERGYLYFRPMKDRRLLLGGGRHWISGADQTASMQTDDFILEKLKSFAKRMLGLEDIRVATAWAGTMGVGAQRMPLVKAVDDGFVACVRLGGMGVALSSSLGERATELLLES